MTNQEAYAYEELCKKVRAYNELKGIVGMLIKDLEKLIELASEDNTNLNADISDVDLPVFMSISNLGAINAWEIELSKLKFLLQKGGEE